MAEPTRTGAILAAVTKQLEQRRTLLDRADDRGCGINGVIPFSGTRDVGPTWGWDGQRAQPTLERVKTPRGPLAFSPAVLVTPFAEVRFCHSAKGLALLLRRFGIG